MTSITPIAGLARRIPIVATLRNGATAKGGRPISLDKWRVTTGSRRFADAFADRYGGEVKPWTAGPPNHFEVFSDATEVAIALIEDGFDISYQLWSAGGMQRKCDGETCEVLSTTGPDNVEYTEAPCLCDRKGVLECGLRSRLTFVMPDLPFGGGVTYKTGSKNFAEEAQGMLRLIQQLQAQGIQRGVLRLEQRKSTGNRKYTIAVVSVTESLDNIASGESTRALGTAPAPEQKPELSSPPPEEAVEEEESVGVPPAGSSNNDDDEVYEAEIVEDGETPAVVLEKSERARYRAAFMARAKGLGLDYEQQIRPWLQSKYGLEGDDAGWSELSDEQALNLYHALIVPKGTQKEKDEAGQRFKAAVLGEKAA